MPKDEWSYIVVVSFFNGIKTMIISMPKNVWILYGIVLFITALPKILKHDK